jgi:hypothetical protein
VAPPRSGQERVVPTNAWDGDFNQDSGGSFVYLCYGAGGTLPAITDVLAFSTPSLADPGEKCPSGYTKVGNGSGTNFKSGASFQRGDMYLCYRRDPGGTPISMLQGVAGNHTACPAGTAPVNGTAAEPGVWDFNPVGTHLTLCVTRDDSSGR